MILSSGANLPLCFMEPSIKTRLSFHGFSFSASNGEAIRIEELYELPRFVVLAVFVVLGGFVVFGN